MKVVLVFGGRYFKNKDLLYKALDILSPDHIISGGASGADTLAEKYADERGIAKEIYPVTSEEWARWGKRAGYLRNRKIGERLKHYQDSGHEALGLHTRGGKGTDLMCNILDNLGLLRTSINSVVIEEAVRSYESEIWNRHEEG